MNNSKNLITLSLISVLTLTGCKATEQLAEFSDNMKEKLTQKDSTEDGHNDTVEASQSSENGISDAQLTRNQGTAIGAAIGATAGALIGGTKEHAMLGAFIGGAIGNVFADHVANKKADYADSESYMNAMLEEADRMLELSRKEQVRLIDQIKVHDEEVAALKPLIVQQKVDMKRLNKTKSGIENNIQRVEKLQSFLVEEINLQAATLEKEKTNIDVVLVSQSESKISELESEKRKSESQLQKLKLLSNELAKQDHRES